MGSRLTPFVLCLLLATSFARAGEGAALIPRKLLFGNPDHANVQISHDGKFLSYLAPSDGVMNVWIAPIDDIAHAKVVTHDTKRGIADYFWAWTNNDIIYRQDEGGNENYNIF